VQRLSQSRGYEALHDLFSQGATMTPQFQSRHSRQEFRTIPSDRLDLIAAAISVIQCFEGAQDLSADEHLCRQSAMMFLRQEFEKGPCENKKYLAAEETEYSQDMEGEVDE
jgi:hypothetical protein